MTRGLVLACLLAGLPGLAGAEAPPVAIPFGATVADWRAVSATFAEDRHGQCPGFLGGMGWLRMSREHPPAQQLVVASGWGLEVVLWLEPERAWVVYPPQRQREAAVDARAPWRRVISVRPGQVTGVDLCRLIPELLTLGLMED